jgi:hypothetical protein
MRAPLVLARPLAPAAYLSGAAESGGSLELSAGARPTNSSVRHRRVALIRARSVTSGGPRTQVGPRAGCTGLGPRAGACFGYQRASPRRSARRKMLLPLL